MYFIRPLESTSIVTRDAFFCLLVACILPNPIWRYCGVRRLPVSSNNEHRSQRTPYRTKTTISPQSAVNPLSIERKALNASLWRFNAFFASFSHFAAICPVIPDFNHTPDPVSYHHRLRCFPSQGKGERGPANFLFFRMNTWYKTSPNVKTVANGTPGLSCVGLQDLDLHLFCCSQKYQNGRYLESKFSCFYLLTLFWPTGDPTSDCEVWSVSTITSF